jgi:hypothetical protein
LVDTFGSQTKSLPEQFAYFSIRDVITTNYDTLLERALPWYDAISPSHGLEKLLSNEFKIIKIHGSVVDPQSCVLSLSKYVRVYNVNLHWYLTNVFSTCTCVFLGSSMNPAEPYFRVLRLLKASRRARKRHFAVVAVRNSQSGAQEGKRLQEFGVELIPYIPDSDHSFLDELLGLMESQRGSSEAIQQRLKTVRSYLGSNQPFDAAIHLWHATHANISRIPDRRALGDVVSEFNGTTLRETLVGSIR